MKRRRYLKISTIFAIFGLSGCLGYMNDPTEYNVDINEGGNLTIVDTKIQNQDLSVTIQNDVNRYTRATLRVTLYDQENQIIGKPSVYSTDKISPNTSITKIINLNNSDNISRYEIRARLND